ncbi:MAG TPA: mechanosensitive ion channel [Verrucomicrobiota bacterium]|nr:mechanosensitive ion channel [Verrucomicrobiota bacterium]
MSLAPTSQSNLPAGATSAEVIDYRTRMQRLIRTYQLHLDDLAALEAVRQRIADLERSRRAWTGFTQPPPYPLTMVDELHESAQVVRERIRAEESKIKMTETFIADAREEIGKTEEQLRRLNEQLEAAKDTAAGERLRWQRELETTRNRVAAATIGMFEARRQLSIQELAENKERLAFLDRQLTVARQSVEFSQAELDKVLNQFDAEQRELEKELSESEARLESLRTGLAETRQLLETTSLERTNATAITQLRTKLDLLTVQEDTEVQRLTVLRQMLGTIGTKRQLWQMCFRVFNSNDPSQLQEASRKLAKIGEVIQTARPYFQQQAALASNQFADERARLQSLPQVSAGFDLVRERADSYRQRETIYTRALQTLEQHQRLVSRWQEAIQQQRSALPFLGRVRDLFTDASQFIFKLWHFELFTAEDTITVDGQQITGRRGITVGKIAMALIILVVGYWLADILSRLIEPIAVKRLKIERNQAVLIRRWVRVVLILTLVVFSLTSVKIPLTVFAFAGGALAIGVGFGTQTLLKNFISGIIILFERPFRVGDVLDVDDQRGTVTSIGIRSSVIQRWDGTETLIPNSTLLESSVTNWTYTNRSVRFTVSVGVAYGSDTRRVAQLLDEIAERHGLVQDDPKPQIIFTEFGDNALIFELRYWVDILKNNGLQIGSDLRHMIATTFAENNISIAFPQRDVHLDTVKPLQLQMLPPEGSSPTSVERARPSTSGIRPTTD